MKQSNWPEAVRDSIGWIAVALIVFSLSRCSIEAFKARAQIMTSPGNHVE